MCVCVESLSRPWDLAIGTSHSPPGRLAEPEAATLMAQIVAAVRYIHGEGIAHRDIKAENVLLTAHGVAKVPQTSSHHIHAHFF